MNGYTSRDRIQCLKWGTDVLVKISKSQETFNELSENGWEKSESFLFWDKFLIELAPVLKDLTRLFHDGD